MSACASTRRRGARRAAALPAGRARRPDASGAPWEPGVTGHCCGGHHTGARCVWLSRDKVSHDERTGRNAEPSAAAHAWHLQHDCAAPDRPQVGQTLSAWHSWVTDGADEALLTRRRNQPRGAQSFAQRSSAAGLACAHRSAETAMGWVRRPYRNSRAAGGPESRPGLVREEASARNTPSIFHRSTQQGAPAAMARRPPVAPAAAPRPVRRARASARVGSRAGSCVGAGRAACLALEGHGAVVLARQVEAERQHRALAAQRRQRRRRLLRRRRRRAARRVARARRPRVGHAAPAPARRPAAGCALAAMTRNLKLGPRTGACVSASCCVHAAAARRAGCGAPRRRRARALGGIMRIPELRRSPRRMRRGLDAQRGSRRRPRRRCRQAAPRQRAPQLQPKAPPR